MSLRSKNGKNSFIKTLSLLTALLSIPLAYAGDDRVDLDVERYLKVNSRVSNGYRFDIIEPKEFYVTRSDGTEVEATNYDDFTLIVKKYGGKLVFSESLDYQPSFDKNEVLSTDYVLLRSFTGGGVCCYQIAVYRTNPTFKKIYEKVLASGTEAEVLGPDKIKVMKLSDSIDPLLMPRSDWRYDEEIVDLEKLR